MKLTWEVIVTWFMAGIMTGFFIANIVVTDELQSAILLLISAAILFVELLVFLIAMHRSRL